jgi:uncharacterized membrane protein
MGLSFVHPKSLYFFLLVPLIVGLALLGRRRPTRGRFWAGLILRVFLLTLTVFALAGAQLRTRADTLTAVFVLDVSDSVPAEEQARGEAAMRRAIAEMPVGDRAAVVVFGQESLVERLASEDPVLPDLASVPVTARTDIASALQLAMALLPDEGAKRLVLLSDGRENLGQALAQAELAAAHGIELSFVSLGGLEGDAEVLIEALNVPANVHLGQRFDLVVLVRSTVRTGATLRALADGQLTHSQEVRLQPGTNRFLIPVEADRTGFRRFRVQIIPDADTRLQNNGASAFAVVLGPPSVLLVEGQPGETDNIAEALRASEMDVTVVVPADVPTVLSELAAYDGIVLANVLANALPPEALEAMQVYVRDLGKGLMVTGGENAFGAGGYLRTPLEEALPVDMDVRSKEQSPSLALVLVVDKSGSMGRCHCDNPDLNQSYTRQEIGQPKVDIAKEAIMRAAGALGPQDYLGVVAFDEAARWALDVQQIVDVIELERSIGSIQAQGQTNLRAGVETAYAALQGVEARFKHVILMTDGWVRSGDLTALAESMRDQGITLSVVAAGGGSAEYLADLAECGGGRYYPAVDILRVPDFFLKETIKAVGEYIIEDPFYPLPSMPSPVMRGLDATTLPLLLGYNGATPKSTARVVLGTPRGDPLLATWQYGLGRSAAWTSDLKGQWATEWVSWDGFARFVAQLVSWTLPTPQVEGMTAQAVLRDDQALIQVEVVDETGSPRSFLDVSMMLIGPDLETIERDLLQVGAGQYEAAVELSEPGTYLVRASVHDGEDPVGQQTMGLVVPYSPEYKASGTDTALLGQLARLTGGGELLEPMAAFLHNLPSADRAREIWRLLLMVVALLFPLDVAIRRVMLTGRDLGKAVDWVGQRLPFRKTRSTRREPVLGRLYQARERARTRRVRTRLPAPSVWPEADHGELEQEQGEETARPAETRTPTAVSTEDTLSRLRNAKRRARRQD